MKVFVLNTIEAGIDVLNLIRAEVEIAGYIGLLEKSGNTNISGFVNGKDRCGELGIPYIECNSYNLSSQSDIQQISKLDIDVLLVLGWQRLVPKWLLNHCKVCAVGIHGSPFGIVKGRGRSPQNWAFILGQKRFELSIFKITEGVDDGEIIATRSFNFEDSEDIRTTYIKNSILTATMLTEAFKNNSFAEKGKVQHDELAEYLPQRRPEDGHIDWERKPGEIHQFIKALTRPYPGAYTFFEDVKIEIWRSVPFTTNEYSGYAYGTIIGIMAQGELIVKCNGGFILVREFSLSEDVCLQDLVGRVLSSKSFVEQMKQIVERHKRKRPDQKLSSLIQNHHE